MERKETSPFIACPWCGQVTRLEFVKGHYQCTSCKTPVSDCCDGEQSQEGIEP